MADSIATTARLLELLDLFGRRVLWTGPELSAELGTTERTVRRDVERLRSLGYRIDAAQGVGGGYRLGPGRRLPPLLLNDDEAVHLAVALRTAVGSAGEAESDPALRDAALSALDKLDQHMPSRLREQVAALVHGSVALGPGGRPAPDTDALLLFSRAIRDHREVGFDYVDGRGATGARTVHPHRLVAANGRWYLQAFDVDRAAWRSFRVDRADAATARMRRFAPREDLPPADEALGASRPADTWPIGVELVIDAPLAEVRRLAGGHYVELTEDPGRADRTRYRTSGSDVDAIALHVARLPWEFRVLEPSGLRGALGRLAARLSRAATD